MHSAGYHLKRKTISLYICLLFRHSELIYKMVYLLITYGVAAGTGATLNPGTELCKKEDTERLFKELKQQ